MKNIKKIISMAMVAILITACSDIRFDKLPGMYQDLIPMEIQGKYIFYGKDFKSRLLDTLEVNIGHNDIILNGTQGETRLILHQDFNLHKLGDLYIIGNQDKVIKSLWNLNVIEPTSKGLNFYTVNNKEIKPLAQNKLELYFPFLDIPFNYDPIPTEPMILGSTDGGVAPGTPNMLRYYSMNDEQFKNYFENELKNKEFIPLKKDSKEKSKKSK
jgi:hypothetical protein